MPKFILVLLLFFTILSAFGQITSKDSLRIKAIVAITKDSLEKVALTRIDMTKIDSTKIEKFLKPPYKISPKIATKRSAMIPGWGQAYAKQYWFIPLIYAGFGGSAFGIIYNGKRYQILRKAYLKTSAENALDGTVTAGKFTLNKKNYELSIANLKQYTNYFRRNRDLSWLSIPVVWAVNVLEINVATHLKTFDMSDDITMKLEPSFEQNPFNNFPTIGGKIVFALK